MSSGKDKRNEDAVMNWRAPADPYNVNVRARFQRLINSLCDISII